MSLLFPPPGPPEPSRLKRLKNEIIEWCSHLSPEMKEWNHKAHIASVAVFLAVAVLARFLGSDWEWLVRWSEMVVAGLLLLYGLVWLILLLAKRADVSTTAILREWDYEVDRALQNAGAALGGVFGAVRFVRTDEDLDEVVKLTHDALGVQHEDKGFSRERRRELYFRWVKAHAHSILLLTPNFGRAAGETVGVSIILPLRDEAVSELWSGCGVLGLSEKQILPSKRRAITSLLADTLLLREDVIEDYRQLMVHAFHLHLGRFYHKRYWPRTTLYTVTLKPRIGDLLRRRGFEWKTKSKEGEDLFQFVVGHAAGLDPLQRKRYEREVRLIDTCAEQWQTAGAFNNRPSAPPVGP